MSMWRIPLADVEVDEQDIEAVLDCLRSGWLTMGPRVAGFEEALSSYLGGGHVAATSSGTASLHLALLAAGVGHGDEVLVPALTFVASASTVRHVGAQPVLCDIRGPQDLNIDPQDAARRITPRTKAVIAVHFFGYPADLAALRELCDTHGLILIEDCAEAIGATVEEGPRKAGTVGDLAAFSLFSKSQLCVGEGGMVVTRDEGLDRRVRLLRSHGLTSGTWDRHRGHDPAYDVIDIGMNYRMDEPRAALGLSRLARLDEDIAARREIVRSYREQLGGLPGVEIPWGDQEVQASSHFAFAIMVRDRGARDRLRVQLADAGVQSTWYPALHRFTEYRTFTPPDGLPLASEAAERHCALPLAASMGEEEVRIVTEAVRSALNWAG